MSIKMPEKYLFFWINISISGDLPLENNKKLNINEKF